MTSSSASISPLPALPPLSVILVMRSNISIGGSGSVRIARAEQFARARRPAGRPCRNWICAAGLGVSTVLVLCGRALDRRALGPISYVRSILTNVAARRRLAKMTPECQRRKAAQGLTGAVMAQKSSQDGDGSRRQAPAGGGSAPDAPAGGAGRAAVRGRRPPRDGRSAARRGRATPACRCRSPPSTTRCTSSPRRACCARSWSMRRAAISTRIPAIISISIVEDDGDADRHSGRAHRGRRRSRAAQGHGGRARRCRRRASSAA